MSLGDVIARLAVNLTMETAAFEEGASAAEKRLSQSAKNFEKFGSNMTALGGKLSLAFTAPLAALGHQVLGMADKAKDLQNAATVAGASFEEFQRGAHAAKSVGMEFDKFGDIMKDVQDKVGDFAANGGGPMKDFFDNIAPKVGVTIDQFKKLSGPEALQLYYTSLEKAGVSQKEMVFYMEALAGDATNLIPLLAENGKLMKEIGGNAAILSAEDAEGFKRFTEAQNALSLGFDRLMIAVAKSGLIDFATALIAKGAELVNWFGSLSPQAQQVGVAIGAIAAAAGPTLVVLGSLISSGSTVFAALSTIGGYMASTGTALGAASVGISAVGAALAALGPVIAVVAAVAAAGYAIYTNWDKIAPILQDLWNTVQSTIGPPLMAVISALSEAFSALWNGPLGSAIKFVGQAIGNLAMEIAAAFGQEIVGAIKIAASVIGAVASHIADYVRMVTALFKGDWAAAFNYASQIVQRMFGSMPAKVIGWMQQMVGGIKTQVVDRLNAIWDGVVNRVKAVGQSFFKLYDAVVGHSYVPDMVDEIGVHMRRLDSEMVEPADKAIKAVGDRFEALRDRVQSLTSELFPEIAQRDKFRTDMETIDIAEGRGIYTAEQATEARNRLLRKNGALEGTEEISTNGLPTLVGALDKTKGKVGESTDAIAQSFGDMAQSALGSLRQLVDGLKSGDIFSILGSAASLIGTLIGGNTGNILVKAGGGLSNGLPGYASGTSYAAKGMAWVGEKGPELVNFRGGERVYNAADSKQMANGRSGQSVTYDMRGAVVTEDLLAQMNQVAAGQANMAVINERRASIRKNQRRF